MWETKSLRCFIVNRTKQAKVLRAYKLWELITSLKRQGIWMTWGRWLWSEIFTASWRWKRQEGQWQWAKGWSLMVRLQTLCTKSLVYVNGQPPHLVRKWVSNSTSYWTTLFYLIGKLDSSLFLKCLEKYGYKAKTMWSMLIALDSLNNEVNWEVVIELRWQLHQPCATWHSDAIWSLNHSHLHIWCLLNCSKVALVVNSDLDIIWQAGTLYDSTSCISAWLNTECRDLYTVVDACWDQ